MTANGKEEKIELIPVRTIKPLMLEVTMMGRAEAEMLRLDMNVPESQAIYNIDPIRVRTLTPEEKEECREKYPNAEYEVVDGHKRLRTATLLHWENINAYVMTITRDEALLVNYKKNKARGTVDLMLEALAFKHFYITRNMPAHKVAEMFGVAEKYVYQILKRVRISKEATRTILRQTIVEQPLTGKHLEAIASLPEEKQATLATLIVEEKLGAKETEKAKEAIEQGLPREEAIKIAKQPKPKKPKDEAESFTCQKCGAEYRIKWRRRTITPKEQG